MYDDARLLRSPEQGILDFCQTTYAAGATLAKWDRDALEVPSSSQAARKAG